MPSLLLFMLFLNQVRVNLLKPVKKKLSSDQPAFCPFPPAFFFLCALDSFESSFFILCTNRILKYLTINLIFHMLLCQVPKRKRRVSFPCRKQVFFRTNELQRSQQSLVSGVSFPKQVSRPPCSPHWPVADLASAPLGAVGARTGWKNRPGH